MRAQELIANNLANLHTTGFRRERMAFHRVLQEETAKGAGAQKLVSHVDDARAEIFATGAPLDFGLDGEGYFVVKTPEGDRYTRAGGFQRTPAGALATAQGYAVMGDGGELSLPPGDINVADDGTVRVGSATVGRLRVATVAAEDLIPVGENLFSLREGAAPSDEGPTTLVRQGFLERSNVSPVDEMVEMLTIFREYETNFKAMRIQGDTLGKLIEQQMR